jgi:hypothetical protein
MFPVRQILMFSGPKLMGGIEATVRSAERMPRADFERISASRERILSGFSRAASGF